MESEDYIMYLHVTTPESSEISVILLTEKLQLHKFSMRWLLAWVPRGVDLTNLRPDVCVKDSETDPF